MSIWSFRILIFHLDCRTEGLNGYFDPANWQVKQEIIRKGDGGVDVTGAPDARLVEGADGALAFAAPGGTLHLQRIIPAKGFLALDLVKVGSSISFSPTIIISVNGKELKQVAPLKNKYSFFLSSTASW